METEFLEIDRSNAWNKVYQEIRNESNNYAHIVQDAKKLENKNLNRYRDVNPFDHSRVRLQRTESDYINASLVNVPSASRSYILTQGPLPSTTGHFWLMIWEQQSKGILMLNRIIEKNTVKCHQYWPIGRRNHGDDILRLPDVNLMITFISEEDFSHYTIRKFCLTDLESSQSREILQFHYTTWPDFGVPESPAAFLSFLFTVRESGVLNNNVGPPVVHCSAGIGRSGTFCLVDSCLVLMEKTSNPVNVREQLLEMRHYRMGLIQTPDQLRFSYLAIIEGAKIVLPERNSVANSLETNDNLYQTYDGTIHNKNSDLYSFPLSSHSSQSCDDLSSSIDSMLCNLLKKEELLEEYQSEVLNAKQNDFGINNCQEESFQNNVSTSVEENEDGYVVQSKAILRNESASEVRKRARKEREEKTAMMVQNIKKKQKESELWDRRKSIIKASIGLVLFIGLGFFALQKLKA